MMTEVEKRLEKHGLTVPSCPVPVAAYVPAQIAGRMIFASGQCAWVDDELLYRGRVGEDVSLEEAYQSAKISALRCISELKSVADLDSLRIVKVTGFVNAVPGYEKQPKVINGASELIELAFGEKGKHARAAVGVGSLPDNASVEIEIIAYIED